MAKNTAPPAEPEEPKTETTPPEPEQNNGETGEDLSPYVATDRLNHNGKRYEIGDRVEGLTEAQAFHLMAGGVLAAVAG